MPVSRKSFLFRVVFGLLMLVSTTLSLLNVASRQNLCSSRCWLGVRSRTTGRRRTARINNNEDDNKDLVAKIDRIIGSSRKTLKGGRRYKVGGKLLKDRDGFVLNNLTSTGDRFSEGKHTMLVHACSNQINL